MRRLQEQAERQGTGLYALFLDWEKAFDKIHPQSLLAALRRFGVQEEFVQLIHSIYQQPQFQVRAMGHTSTTKVARSGIRQGCPLSPYLFLVVHSAIMHDVQERLTAGGTQQLPWIHSQRHPLFDLAYADDTVIVCKSAQKTQEILQHIEAVAAQYNLSLHQGKCELLRLNVTQPVLFTSGMPVKVKNSVTYLGVTLRADGKSHTDVAKRIAKARAGYKQLQKFWRHTDIPTQWKLKVFNTVFVPMLTYGMESAALTAQDLHSLDSIQADCLRKVINIKSTYFTKVLNPTATTYTNQQVTQHAKQRPLSQQITQQQIKFLGHLLRSDTDQLEFHSFLTAAFVYRAGSRSGSDRRGRPRGHWIEQVCHSVWDRLKLSQHVISTYSPQLCFPHCLLQFRNIAANRAFWGRLSKLPTCSGAQDIPVVHTSHSERTTLASTYGSAKNCASATGIERIPVCSVS